MLDYATFGHGDGPIWIVLHGFLQGQGFAQKCRIQDHVRTCYPLAPGRLGNWCESDAADLETLAWHLMRAERRESVVLAGFSDGCSPIHRAAANLGGYCAGLVHYAGLWPRRRVAVIRGSVVCCYGRRDWTPMPIITRRVANSYRARLLVLGGGHRWDSGSNRQIVKAIQAGKSVGG